VKAEDAGVAGAPAALIPILSRGGSLQAQARELATESNDERYDDFELSIASVIARRASADFETQSQAEKTCIERRSFGQAEAQPP